MNKIFIFFLFILGFYGCANHAYVIPKEKGSYEILSYSSTEEGALKKGLKKAEETCKALNQKWVVLDKSITYHGVLTQQANKLAEKAQEALVVTTGQYVPSPNTDEDYHGHITFRCE